MNAEERTEQARRAILTAACEVIAEAGFEGVRMRMVAERAGVSTALLHYHFANRDKLFIEALRFSYDHAGNDILGGEPPAKAPHAWRLARAVDTCLPIGDELRRDFLLWQELRLRAVRDKDTLDVAQDLYANLRDWIAAIVRDGQAAGEFATADPVRLADLVIALTDGYGARMLLGRTAMAADDARDQIWAVVAPLLGLAELFPARA